MIAKPFHCLRHFLVTLLLLFAHLRQGKKSLPHRNCAGLVRTKNWTDTSGARRRNNNQTTCKVCKIGSVRPRDRADVRCSPLLLLRSCLQSHCNWLLHGHNQAGSLKASQASTALTRSVLFCLHGWLKTSLAFANFTMLTFCGAAPLVWVVRYAPTRARAYQRCC